jgi:hypothetical protein
MLESQDRNNSMGVRRNQQLPVAAGETRCRRIIDGNMHWRVLETMERSDAWLVQTHITVLFVAHSHDLDFS